MSDDAGTSQSSTAGSADPVSPPTATIFVPDSPALDVQAAAPAPAEPPSSNLIDLSHLVEAGMTTYPGLPGPTITPHMTREASRDRYAEGTEFAIDSITLVGNTGTYVDSPYHRYPEGPDLAGLPLASLADLPIALVSVADSDDRAIDVAVFDDVEVGGCAVLLHTGWDVHWGTTEYGVEAPYLSGDAALYLVERGARLVGIDSVNIDDIEDGARPAHSILLRAGIPVLEHLTGLDRLPATGARLHAVPPKIRDVGTFPVRAYAIVPEPAS
jgi:arylformamidase